MKACCPEYLNRTFFSLAKTTDKTRDIERIVYNYCPLCGSDISEKQKGVFFQHPERVNLDASTSPIAFINQDVLPLGWSKRS